MQNKRDQLQAHRFVIGRLGSAVLVGDADAEETPTRRFSTASIIGIVLSVLIVAGFTVYGLVRPGHSTAWREPGALVVARESGTRYVLDGQTLRPVLNLASARLLLGEQARVVSVSERSLADVARGMPVGIPDGPDTLPEPAELVTGAWAVCVADGAEQSAPGTLLLVGSPVTVTTTVDDRAVLVATPDGAVHLLWQEQRFRVAEDAALVALGLESYAPVAVPEAWLAAVPEGPPLAPPDIEGLGAPGPALGGQPTRVGQVVTPVTPGSDRSEYYLVLPDGLSPVPPTEAAMILADPDSAAAYDGAPVAPVEVAAEAVTAAGRATGPDWSAFPGTQPEPLESAHDSRRQLCVRLSPDGSGPPETQLVLAAADSLPPAREPAVPGVDVRVPTGRGVLVRGPQQAAEETPMLVDELGVRYELGSADAVRALGFADVPPVVMPSAVLGLLPAGPVLDVDEAGQSRLGAAADRPPPG